MNNQESIFWQYLEKKGLRFTKERRIILNGLMTISGHFDADTLYNWLHNHDKQLSKATIYRAINLFVKCGLLKESLRTDGRAQYEVTYGLDHHDHLICISCGKIIEFKENTIERLQEDVCKKHGFKPIDHRLSINGYCSACQKKQ